MAEKGIVTIDDIEMPYAKFGNGPKSFIIIPGVSTRETTIFAESVEGAFAQFKEEYTCYLIDRRRQIPKGYSIKDMADDTAKVMRYLNIEKASIFGASQGGMITLMLAIYYPELVEKIVVGSSEASCTDTLMANVDNWLAGIASGNQGQMSQDMAKAMYSENMLAQYKTAILRANMGLSDSELEHFARLCEAIKGYDVREKLADIQCPALVIGALGDKVMGAESSKKIAALMQCDLIMYGEEFGHTVYDEAPDYRSKMFEWLVKC